MRPKLKLGSKYYDQRQPEKCGVLIGYGKYQAVLLRPDGKGHWRVPLWYLKRLMNFANFGK